MKDKIKTIKIYPTGYPSSTKDETCSHIRNILFFNLMKEEDLPFEIEFKMKYKNKKKE